MRLLQPIFYQYHVATGFHAVMNTNVRIPNIVT